MNCIWQDGKFILASTLEDKIRSLENQVTKLLDKNRNLMFALQLISTYDSDSTPGICPYGCDCPNIAQEALNSYSQTADRIGEPSVP